MTAPKFNKDDLPNHPAYIAAFSQMLDMIPEAEKERMHAEAMSILGNPQPDGYDVSGNPVYTAQTMARSSGIPLTEIEEHCHEYHNLFGKPELDSKVTVLKQPEVEYQITATGAVILALLEWIEGVIPMINGWLDLAVSRGLKPIVVHQLKAMLNNPEWKRHEVEPYLNRIYQYTSANEFLTDFMGGEAGIHFGNHTKAP